MRPAVFRAAFALFVLGTFACPYVSQPVYPDPPVADVVADGIKLIPQSIQLTAIGETRQLLVTVTPANATDRRVIWESSDSTVATIDSTGIVTARAPGSGVFVSAFTHDRRHEASVNVTVEAPQQPVRTTNAVPAVIAHR